MHAYRVTRQMLLWRDSQQLLLLIEQAVRDFPRYHKYTVGTELRWQAMQIYRLLARTCHDKAQMLVYVIQLNEAIDDLKIQLQLVEALAAIRHLKTFETIARLAVAVGKQSVGWQQRLTQTQTV